MFTSQSVSEIPKTYFSHFWTINNFKSITKSDLVNEEYMCSSEFPTPNLEHSWYLKLRPFSTDPNGTEFIGVHLFMSNAKDRDVALRAYYEISVMD
ncbi:hypothetical protein B4U80_00119, partial [Leptotrombidium deliense]